MLVLVDTSAWIAVVVKSDKNHKLASGHYTHLLEKNAKLVTSNYILSETHTRIRYDVNHSKAVEFHRIISKAHREKRIVIIRVDEKLEEEAWKIFENYSDQIFSFVDCTSFAVCRKLEIDEIFAFDDDFKTMGYIVKP